MIDSLCTIIYQPEEIIEGSTFEKLITIFPNAAFHDLKNRLFNGIDEDAFDPLVVSTFKDSSGVELSGDALVYALAPYLFADNRERPIHIKKSVLSQLYRHSTYRLYCGNYETVEELNIDHLLVFGVDADSEKTIDELNEESRLKLEAHFQPTQELN